MKTVTIMFTILLAASLLAGCSTLTDLVQKAKDVETITPSDTIITESRDVTGFTKIDMSTFGEVILTQGASESLTIEGSDNIVPLVRTTVTNGKLTIETTKNINVLNLGSETTLTFNITVKDLTELTFSGAGLIKMDALSTTSLNLIMSGAGSVTFGQFAAEQLDINVSGVGGLEIAGKITKADIELSGIGGVKAGDLECQTATVNISGLGDVTVWVTDQLSGTISGGGSVSYYGNPQVDTTTTGVGKFNSLGDK
jgi:hypothetical protein